jgi:hypothetical protein
MAAEWHPTKNGDLTPKELTSKIKTICRNQLETFKVPVKIFIEESSFRSERFKKQRNKYLINKFN